MTDRAAILTRSARLAAAGYATHKHLAERLGEAARLILGADGAWITIHNETPNRTTLCATDPVSIRLEDFQEVLGEGPCGDAFRTGEPVTTTLRDDPGSRWPEFTRAAWESVGPLTICAVPMRPGQETFGVLSFYFHRSGDVPESLETSQFLADSVGVALLRDPESADGETAVAGVWSSRAEIHQATGMVIAQLHVPAEDALAILRAHAYAHDATLAGIAHRVVTRQLDFREES